MTVDKFLALAVALACGVMLLRMVIGPKHRRRLDAFAWRTWHWRRRRQARQEARRTAQAAIARARQPGAHGEVQRDGNVLRPDSFQRPRKPH